MLARTGGVRARASATLVETGLLGRSVPLAGTAGLTLTAEEQYSVDDTGGAGSDRWLATLRGYRHQFYSGGAEVILFHWHPIGLSRITEPHLHVGEGRLRGLHVPSGEIGLGRIIEFAIRELRAVPTRDDWESLISV
ncbi:MAG: hypothetical protein ACKVT1_13505 [Dehalococcoidia bacterium]